MLVDSSRKDTLENFCKEIQNASVEIKVALSIETMREGLMNPPFLIKLIIKFMGKEKLLQKLQIILNQSAHRKSLDDFISNLCKWIIDGKDSSSTSSIGGFNQQELYRLKLIMKEAGWIEPE